MVILLKVAALVIGISVGLALAILPSKTFNDAYSMGSGIDHLTFAFSTDFFTSMLLFLIGMGTQVGLWFASSAISEPTTKLVKVVVLVLCIVGASFSLLLGGFGFAAVAMVYAIAIMKLVRVSAFERENNLIVLSNQAQTAEKTREVN